MFAFGGGEGEFKIVLARGIVIGLGFQFVLLVSEKEEKVEGDQRIVIYRKS